VKFQQIKIFSSDKTKTVLVKPDSIDLLLPDLMNLLNLVQLLLDQRGVLIDPLKGILQKRLKKLD
jgi:hypothetical protein